MDMIAGVPISIGGLILWLSGDCDTDNIIKDITVARKQHPADTLHEYMRAVIITAFPTYNLDDIESWDRLEFIRKFVISENILKKKEESYECLDLSKIGQEPKSKKDLNKPIDFAAENAAIRRNQNPMDIEDARNSISEREASVLDNRKRR